MAPQIQLPGQLFEIDETEEILYQGEKLDDDGTPFYIVCERVSGLDVQGQRFHYGKGRALHVGNKTFSNRRGYTKKEMCIQYLDQLAVEVALEHNCSDDVEFIGPWNGDVNKALKAAKKK